MATIKNINDRFGDPIVYVNATIDDAVEEMKSDLISCGYLNENDMLREGVDYVVIDAK